MKTTLKLSAIVAVSIFLLVGCSEKLTREKAQELIIAKNGYPKDETTPAISFVQSSYVKFFSADRNEHRMPVKNIPLLLQMENAGLVKYSVELAHREVGEGTWWSEGRPGEGAGFRPSAFRDEAWFRKYGYAFGYEIQERYKHIGALKEEFSRYTASSADGPIVKVAKRDIGEVTGITEQNENIAVVQYTEIRTDITPFGKILGQQEESIPKTCYFRKYDDGWRVE